MELSKEFLREEEASLVALLSRRESRYGKLVEMQAPVIMKNLELDLIIDACSQLKDFYKAQMTDQQN